MGICDRDTTDLWYEERDCLYEIYGALEDLLNKMDMPMRHTNRFYEVYWKGRKALDDYKSWQKAMEEHEAEKEEKSDA